MATILIFNFCTFARRNKTLFPHLILKALTVSSLPTKYGRFEMAVFESAFPEFPHVALFNGLKDTAIINVRIHSECMTGDVFGSIRCDCGEQLEYSLEHFGKNGGILIYLRQEGRGIGLLNKLKAYNIQDSQGLDTIEANLALGFHSDEREYTDGIAILKTMGIQKIKLFTNNPDKVRAFEASEIEVVERISIIIKPHSENEGYLKTKKDSLGHFLK